jgi:Rrf2 family protein
MKLSTRTRYGLRALVDLAVNGTGQPVQIKDIAERQGISLSYLEHLVIPMIAAGFIQSTRGARGGIKLARPAGQINLKEVVEVLEGPFYPVDCLKGEEQCPRHGLCAAQDVWSELKSAMEDILVKKTVQDLADEQRLKESDTQAMYYI